MATHSALDLQGVAQVEGDARVGLSAATSVTVSLAVVSSPVSSLRVTSLPVPSLPEASAGRTPPATPLSELAQAGSKHTVTSVTDAKESARPKVLRLVKGTRM
ncbi:MAG: hypothetical protein NVSMB1_26240 [Polyangiales bacterium]